MNSVVCMPYIVYPFKVCLIYVVLSASVYACVSEYNTTINDESGNQKKEKKSEEREKVLNKRRKIVHSD